MDIYEGASFNNYYRLLEDAPESLQDEIRRRYDHANVWVHGKKSQLIPHVLNMDFEGWCYESASLSALMLDDNAVVRHGVIDLPLISKNNGKTVIWGDKAYKHAWVDLPHRGKRYVFDPALSMLALADEYNEKLNARIDNEIPAEKIKRFAVDCHLGKSLKQFGNREEHHGFIRGVETDEQSVAQPGEYNELPNPYFDINAGRQDGLLIGDIKIHAEVSPNEQIKGFDAKIYMSC